MSNNSIRETQHQTTGTIQRLVWIALFALLAVVLSFAGYYIHDRYVVLGDRSPADLDIQEMEAVVRAAPRDPQARLELAESYLKAGQYGQALAQAEQVSNLYPEVDTALLLAGIAQVRMDQPEAALEPLQGFVTARHDRPLARTDTALEAAYYFLGESYVKLGRPAEAIPVLEEALLISPTDADALYQAGLAYHALGRSQEALERYHRAVRLVPDFVETYLGMVESYAALEQSDHETYARGMIVFCLKDYRSAATYLEQASQALPDFAPAFLGLGLAYEQLEEFDAASAALQRVIELDPDDFAAQQALGRIEAALKQGR